MMTSLQTDPAEPTGAWVQAAKLTFRFLFVVVCLAAAGWAVSNFRQVPPDSRAVVLRFGGVVRQQGAGLLIAWPRPIEQVVILPSADRQIEFLIDRFESTHAVANGKQVMDLNAAAAGFQIDVNPRNNSGFLLTGDSSVVHLQATLFYEISDPAAYVLAVQHVAPALQRLFVASAVSVCAGRDLDTILVARPELATSNADALASRERLRSDLMNAVNRRLEDLARQGASLGITVSRVDLVASIPSGAKNAFDRVLVVSQQADRDIAQARTDAETMSQRATQASQATIADAQAKAEEQITNAKSQTATISALAEQSPGLSRDMLMGRIYYDRIGGILQKAARVETIDSKGGIHVVLPGTLKNDR